MRPATILHWVDDETYKLIVSTGAQIGRRGLQADP
jgi:hypothetical protein